MPQPGRLSNKLKRRKGDVLVIRSTPLIVRGMSSVERRDDSQAASRLAASRPVVARAINSPLPRHACWVGGVVTHPPHPAASSPPPASCFWLLASSSWLLGPAGLAYVSNRPLCVHDCRSRRGCICVCVCNRVRIRIRIRTCGRRLPVTPLPHSPLAPRGAARVRARRSVHKSPATSVRTSLDVWLDGTGPDLG